MHEEEANSGNFYPKEPPLKPITIDLKRDSWNSEKLYLTGQKGWPDVLAVLVYFSNKSSARILGLKRRHKILIWFNKETLWPLRHL